MAVESKRTYQSTLRSEQAAATRARILDAATELFGQRGYAGTTMAAIAQAAGVSAETVQGHGPKAQLLLSALERAAAGEEGQEGMVERPHVRDILADPDPDSRVARTAAMLAWSNARTWALWRAFGAAAPADPVVGEAYDGLRGRMLEDWRRTVAGLEEVGAVGAGVDHEELVAALWTVALPDAYQRLVIECGWDDERYAAWLTRQLRVQLAGPPTSP